MKTSRSSRFLAWLRFFRIVNLPTLPGDVLVGAGVVCVAAGVPCLEVAVVRALVSAVVASAFLYLYGLADNDIVGASSDSAERPIPAGVISLGAARVARGLCLAVVLAAAALADLPPLWWCVAFALLVAVVVYNRVKKCWLMGLCRALNVLSGLAALSALLPVAPMRLAAFAALPFCVWLAYVTYVTKVSEGEETDPARRAFVGLLIGALVYFQLLALVIETLMCPAVNRLLIVGAVLLVVLRMLRRLLPKVSAS